MSRFDAARLAAVMGDLLRHLQGRPAELLSFDEVREGLQLRSLIDRGITEVPLDRIVGSLGRTREFNRAFLPRQESLRDRWRRLEQLAESAEGFPPVDLYKVGDAYFVVDGHHRVSVARSLDAPTIEASVMEFVTPVPVSAEDSVEELLLRAAHNDFLAVTGLQPEQPDEYRVSVCHGYERLLEHINVHGYFRTIEDGRQLDHDEVVRSWHDLVYRPMIETIRSSGIMADFPERSETDLYLFTMDHLHYLREQYGAHLVKPEEAVRHFQTTQQPLRQTVLGRLRSFLGRLRRRS